MTLDTSQMSPPALVVPELADPLMTRLVDADAHPVLIFGTHSSGKTLMLLSLLAYAQRSGGAIAVRLGDPVFPPGFRGYPPNVIADDPHAYAQQLYNIMLPAFAAGNRPPATQLNAPYFIPIVLGGKNAKERECKFAFMESMGEWYERDPQTPYQFREFKLLVSAILTKFTRPISILFMAPTNINDNPAETQYSYNCLVHCMEEYMTKRIGGIKDNVALLIGKWDTKFNPAQPLFGNVTGNKMADQLQKWGNNFWTTFQNITDPGGPRSGAWKALSPHAAAWINREGHIVEPGEFSPVFKKFNQTLWNWLYGNVAESAARQPGTRAVLFPEVVPLGPSRPGWYLTATAGLLALFSANRSQPLGP